ncbi:MAG TPA: CNNM domain-containing protein [Alphaproteobacteria bacterium]|nr:CNNM domain-containing protein [Alphaproteobacteria bacterium]
MNGLVVLIVVVFLLILVGVFCAIEVAFLYASRARLHQQARDGSKRARIVLDLLKQPDMLLATLVLVLNTIMILSSALTTAMLVKMFGEAGVAYATVIMAVATCIFTEVLPKSLGTRFPEAIALRFARPILVLYKVLMPLTLALRGINVGILKMLRLHSEKTPSFTEGDLRGAISLGLEYGTIHKTEFRMLDAVLNLDEMTVADVMVHSSAIVGLSVDTPPAQLPKILGNLNHTHLPVYKGKPTNFIGILAIRDYLNALGQVAKRSDVVLKNILRPLYTVPETTRLGQQLLEFSKDKTRHMALVTGPNGELRGLMTLEDILEEITGDATHETETIPVTAVPAADGSVVIPGRSAVIDLNRAYGWQLPVDEAVTIAGLMVEEFGRLPAQGESLNLENLTLTVLYKRGHRIETIKITPATK